VLKCSTDKTLVPFFPPPEELSLLIMGYILCDADLKIEGASKSAAPLLDLPPEALQKGQSLFKVCLPLVGNEAQIEAIRAGQLEHLLLEQVNLERQGAKSRYLNLCLLLQPPGFILLLSDVSQASLQQQQVCQQHNELLLLHEKLVLQNDQLQSLNRELGELSQRKSDMLAIATHDLRSPLSGIIAYADLLLDESIFDPLTPDQRLPIESIQRQGKNMLDLVDTLLDLRRLDSSEPQHQNTINLDMLVQWVIRSLQDQAKLAEVTVTYQGAEQPFVVLGDSEVLQQAVGNLLSNGLKYTGRGGEIRLRLFVPPALPDLLPPLDPTLTWGCLTVTDNGPGIAPDDMPHIFEPFFRTKDVRLSGLPGSGLGLTIVQKAIHQHGGRVIAQSQLKEGTTFTIFLPYVTQEAE